MVYPLGESWKYQGSWGTWLASLWLSVDMHFSVWCAARTCPARAALDCPQSVPRKSKPRAVRSDRDLAVVLWPAPF